MTISSTTRKASYSGNGSTTAFSVSFKYLTKSDIVVELIVDSTGATTTQVLDTDYSLTSPGDSGTVTMTTAPATGETLLISRQMSIVQETDYVENDPFPANTHEEALDRLTMICQELDESIKRALALPLSSTTSDLSVPEPVAERFLGWNSAGTALENKTIADASTITLPLSLVNGGTGSTSALAARTALEVNGIQKLIEGAGLVFSASDETLLHKSVAEYSIMGVEAGDSGTANAHVLTHGSGRETISNLEQLLIHYPVNVTNTGAVTIDFSAILGQSVGTTIKDLRNLDNSALTGGECVSGGIAVISYNTTTGKAQLINPANYDFYDGNSTGLSATTNQDAIDELVGDNQNRICRAWCKFSGTGTVSISSSYNIASLVDNGTGDYTINYTNALDNDCVVFVSRERTNANGTIVLDHGNVDANGCRIKTGIATTGSAEDASAIYVAVFGQN